MKLKIFKKTKGSLEKRLMKKIMRSGKLKERSLEILKKAKIRKPLYVIKAEYQAYCEGGNRSPRDKEGFLSVMNLIADNEAKKWIDEERTRLDKIILSEKNGN